MAELPGWAYVVAAVVLLYLILIVTLVAIGGRWLAREAALFVPNLLLLFRGLIADRRVPWRAKVALGVAAIWIASPIDLIPEFIPIAGPLDDAIVAALTLRYVLSKVDRNVIEEHWRGDLRVLGRVLAALTLGQ